MRARTQPKLETADGYIRVSRVGGRAGESFIAPEVQRQKIQAWADLHGVQIVQWWEEPDQSGKKRDRPMFQQALARCDEGETGGIIVARLDRFARSAVDALESIKRLNAAGSRLVSVEDNFDGSTPMGRFAIGILTLIAELELERITENWDTANQQAVERGVHVSGTTPVGYRRDKKKRLVRAEPDASVVREVFLRRARGESWTELADFLSSCGVGTSKGNSSWSVAGVNSLIRNHVYLGEARGGSYTNPTAHEPIVTKAEFDAAQSTRTLLNTRDGSIASQALLGGLARCRGCGHTLKVTGNTEKKTGRRYPVYHCTGRYASGPCPARATIRAQYLDEHVEQVVLEALQQEDSILAQALETSEAAEAAAREVEAAQHELNLYLQTDLISVVGPDSFRAGVRTRQTRLEEAHTRLAATHATAINRNNLLPTDLLQAWPELTTPERRTILHGLLDHITLERDPTLGRDPAPLEQRTTIILRGGSQLTSAPAVSQLG